HRQGEKAAAVGFDWNNADEVMHKVDEELIELKDAIKTRNATSIQHELGDVLMALCSLGRHLSTPAESALREANERFHTRFVEMERIAASDRTRLGDLNAAQKEALWEQAKRRHKQ
ncbi:MAG: MazG nucleotide pyrophosphohydrolase domain-containing protein, partial [Myxococcota bacterium]|nr:MazG nucleotide pyrophosphohydrolase domain-containing protein [Myxococcota bacterium]